VIRKIEGHNGVRSSFLTDQIGQMKNEDLTPLPFCGLICGHLGGRFESLECSILLRTGDACCFAIDFPRACFHNGFSAELAFHGISDSSGFRLINLHFPQ
jgi:hypothetical protein